MLQFQHKASKGAYVHGLCAAGRRRGVAKPQRCAGSSTVFDKKNYMFMNTRVFCKTHSNEILMICFHLKLAENHIFS